MMSKKDFNANLYQIHSSFEKFRCDDFDFKINFLIII
jgi:hypothetical protein